MAKAKSQRDRPPLEPRPIFVSYIAVRKCRYNPSVAGLYDLPKPYRDALKQRWQKRHPQRDLPQFEVSKRFSR